MNPPRTREDYEKEIKELKGWKEQAISVMPPLQEIGEEIGVRLGDSIHDKILPWIIDARVRLRKLTGSASPIPIRFLNMVWISDGEDFISFDPLRDSSQGTVKEFNGITYNLYSITRPTLLLAKQMEATGENAEIH